MRLSRLWFLLVAFAGGLAVAAALVLPDLIQHEVDDQVQLRLVAAERGADALLKLHARKWMDACSHAATDGTLGEALEAASHGASNAELLHKTALERLSAWNAEWKAHEVLAIDTHRRVLARAGQPGALTDEPWGDELANARIVDEALRGYALDDTWVESGRVLKVVAAPVVVRDRYAGALLVVVDVGAELAGPLREMLGVDLAFVAAGKVIAGGGKAERLADAPAILKEHAGDLAGSGRMDPVPLGPNGGAAMVALALPGEASAQEAAVVLAAERPRLASPMTLASLIVPAQLPWPRLLPLLGALAFVLLVGLFLMSREHDARIERLYGAVQAAARGETPRVDDKRLSGRFGTIARSVNAAIDKAVRAVPVARAPESASVSARGAALDGGGISLGDAAPREVHEPQYAPPESPARAIDVEPSAPLGGPPVLRGPAGSAYTAAGGAAPGFAAPMPMLTPPPSPLPTPALATPAAGGLLASLDEVSGVHPVYTPSARPAYLPDLEPASSARSDSLPPAFGDAMPPGYGDAMPPGYGDAMPPGYGDAMPPGYGDAMGNFGGFGGHREPAYAQAAGGLDAGHGASTGRGEMDPFLPPPAPATVAPPVAAPAPPTPVDPLEAELQTIYQDFVDTRQRCGEPTEGVTFEKFAGRLRDQRTQLLSRYGARSVKFTVYVKDGKAALKATPITT